MVTSSDRQTAAAIDTPALRPALRNGEIRYRPRRMGKRGKATARRPGPETGLFPPGRGDAVGASRRPPASGTARRHANESARNPICAPGPLATYRSAADPRASDAQPLRIAPGPYTHSVRDANGIRQTAATGSRRRPWSGPVWTGSSPNDRPRFPERIGFRYACRRTRAAWRRGDSCLARNLRRRSDG